MTFDLILRGGEVFDGVSRGPVSADVAVRNGLIAEVGDLSSAQATEIIDVTSLSVCPGFIDVHAHTDLLPFLPDAHLDVKSAGIRQGVTTEVSGNCGSTPFPLRPDSGHDPYLGAFSEGSVQGFETLADYRNATNAKELIANMAPLIGHGTLRSSVVGSNARAPTSDELVEMRRVLRQAMDEGAFGLSSGLIYAPGMFAQTEELIALSTELEPYGRPYTTHMRDEGDRLEEAVAEAIRISDEAGVGLQISHHKVAGRRNWGRSNSTLATIERARRSGQDVTIDVYPYTAGSTFLAAVLPPWVLDGGPKKMLERIADASTHARIEADIASGAPGWQNLAELAGWDNVIVAGEPPHAGHSIADLASDEGCTEVGFVARLLLSNPGTLIVIHLMEEAEVASIGDQPFAMVGSDGIPLPGQQHPRLAGTFARMLHRHASDTAALGDVIRRMTSLPAGRFSIPDRGVVARGKVADLVVFDRRTVADRATYEDPMATPSGVPHVVLAGELVVRDGALTAARPGRVLEPS